MKFKHHVALVEYDNSLTYVTSADYASRSALWESDKPAMDFRSESQAKDIAEGLNFNGYKAVVLSVPEYLTLTNKSNCFIGIRWYDDDIRNALESNGYEPTDKAVALIRKECKRCHLEDNLTENGWHYLDLYISANADKLKKAK